MDGETKVVVGVSFMAFVLLLLLVPFAMWGCPQYSVYQQRLEGEAELAKAEYNRKTVIQEAMAKYEAAKSLASAEVERAKGVAGANKIIGDSLKGNEDYLRYLWIDGLNHTQDKIIYVPTEGNLPILEASRLVKEKDPEKVEK